MSWLNPYHWLLCAAFVGASYAGIHFWSERLIEQGDHAGYQRAATEYQKKIDQANAKAATETKALQDGADQLRKDKDHEISVIADQRDAALVSVRARPERPSGAAGQGSASRDGQAAAGCTGAQLYREDAGVLVREAARADTIRIELQSCYQQYDAARALSLYDIPTSPSETP